MLKIIFLIFTIVISLIYTLQGQNRSTSLTVRATIPRIIDLDKLDPASIQLDYEYTLIEHLYSPLIEINKNNELVAGIAERFEWIGNEAHLTIRENFKLPDGTSLTPDDVVTTIKRQIILDKNLHGKITSLLCPDQTLKSLEDECQSIKINKNKVIFILPKKIPFLFRLLASIDYAIIPKSVINPKSLDIIGHKVTTGPYILDSISSSKIILRANTTHYNYSSEAPQKIEFIVPNEKSTIMFSNNKLDVITTDDYTTEPHELIDYAKDHDVNLHQTYKIKLNLLMFTKKGKNEIPLERRRKIGKIIRSAFEKELQGNDITQKAYQFFPPTGESALKNNQEEKIIEIYNNVDTKNEQGTGVTLLVSSKRIEYFKNVLGLLLPDLIIDSFKGVPSPYDETGKSGHMFIGHTDTGFFEQIGLLNYSVTFGFFDIKQNQITKWLDTYMSQEDKQTRLEMLNELHFNSLKNAHVVPLYNTAYVALSSKEWSINFSPFYSNTQLWRLRKN